MTQSTLLNLGALMLAASLLVGMIVPFACRLAHRFDFLDRPRRAQET
jgi:hypothetical protein